MALLKPATNGTAFLKMGAFGFEGSGKTHTTCLIAIGLTKMIGKKKVAFFDTEKGSDFHVERFKKDGIDLMVIKSRSFKDLLDTIREVEEDGQYGFLIIDSVTHVWRDLTESYLQTKVERIQKYTNSKKKPIVNLNMKDWNVLKGEWGLFTDLFVNSKAHVAALGRAGFSYDVSEDEEGKQEIVKSGTKMKAEGEFGYESDLLLEMVKVPVAEATKNKKAKGFVNRCIVLKERNDLMNGQSFDSPSFKTFMPVINKLNLGGVHEGVDTTRNSQDMFGDPDYSLRERDKRRDIALDKLQESLILAGLDGTSADAKKRRTEALIAIFGTSSKTVIESMDPEFLMIKVEALQKHLNPQKVEVSEAAQKIASVIPEFNSDEPILI